MKLIIESAGDIIAEIDDYTGPVPRAGEYIYYPPVTGLKDRKMMNLMRVHTVHYDILSREQHLACFGDNHNHTVIVQV